MTPEWMPIRQMDIGTELSKLGDYKRFNAYVDPSTCPICKAKIAPRLLGALNRGVREVFHFYQCSNRECKEAFLARYVDRTKNAATQVGRPGLKPYNVIPTRPEIPEIDEDISELSPDFVDIYTESFIAEQYGLNQICGPGYRKSLEFLVKDYSIRYNGEYEEKIKSSSLSQCIKQYISHPIVQDILEKATWLGNDETHYVRKWIEHDVQDLKRLIMLTTRHIQTHLETENILKSFEKK